MTKEQLISNNARLEKSLNDSKDLIQSWSNKDATIRKEFAKVLGQVSRDYGFSQSTPKDLSWNEIFCEIGKLLQFQNRELIERRLSDLEDRMSQPTTATEISR